MKALVVAFTLYTCPSLAVRVVLPAAARPVLAAMGLCTAQPAFEVYDPAQRRAAYARVRALGEPAQLYPIRGVVVGPALVDWKSHAVIKEIP